MQIFRGECERENRSISKVEEEEEMIGKRLELLVLLTKGGKKEAKGGLMMLQELLARTVAELR